MRISASVSLPKSNLILVYSPRCLATCSTLACTPVNPSMKRTRRVAPGFQSVFSRRSISSAEAGSHTRSKQMWSSSLDIIHLRFLEQRVAGQFPQGYGVIALLVTPAKVQADHLVCLQVDHTRSGVAALKLSLMHFLLNHPFSEATICPNYPLDVKDVG